MGRALVLTVSGTAVFTLACLSFANAFALDATEAFSAAFGIFAVVYANDLWAEAGRSAR